VTKIGFNPVLKNRVYIIFFGKQPVIPTAEVVHLTVKNMLKFQSGRQRGILRHQKQLQRVIE
jgi:hypothetical protein